MTGLFIKDIRLLLQRKQTVVLFLVIALMVGFSKDGYFSIGYMSILCTIYSLSTISYDEIDNGYPFLMTLPIRSKDYVVEKYLFCFLGGMIGWALSVLVYLIANNLKANSIDLGRELLVMATFIPILIVMCSIMIPLQLKYGAEKSRIVFIMIGGGLAAIGVIISKLFPNIVVRMEEWYVKIDQMSESTIIAFGVVLMVTIFLASISWSLLIMKKKEY